MNFDKIKNKLIDIRLSSQDQKAIVDLCNLLDIIVSELELRQMQTICYRTPCFNIPTGVSDDPLPLRRKNAGDLE